jgi:tetratricopeptide (TPR) repeat protein
MVKIGRNQPCPCGSGKKYKKCCLYLHERSSSQQNPAIVYSMDDIDELDRLSNSVVDLISEKHLDEAEEICHQLLSNYPDQIDGIDRLAEVYAAKGDKKRAAEYYRKAADFAQNNPGFDPQTIDWYLSQARDLESEE